MKIILLLILQIVRVSCFTNNKYFNSKFKKFRNKNNNFPRTLNTKFENKNFKISNSKLSNHYSKIINTKFENRNFTYINYNYNKK